MYWLGVDFETTGLEPRKDRITEVGAVLWDMKNKKPVRILNELVYDFDSGVPKISEKVVGLTGITEDLLKRFGANTAAVLDELNDLAAAADFFVAHNAPFDRGFYEEECVKCSISEVVMPWIDTVTDVPYKTDGSLSLSYLAADHGFLNPFSHRAVFDVLTMFKVISEYDPQEIVRWQESPTVTVRALVSFQNKDLAKDLSYKWFPESKTWRKNIKEFFVEKEKKAAEAAGFDVEILNG